MKVARLTTELNIKKSEFAAHELKLHEAKSLVVVDTHESLPEFNAREAHKQLLTSDIKEIEQIQIEFNSTYVDLNIPAYRVTAKSLHENGYDDWMRLRKDELKRPFKEEDRTAYEYFVQGWLGYFEADMKQQNTPKDYTIYFDWGKTREDCALVIYIKPGLEKKIYDDYILPPSPSMTDPIKPTPPPPPTQK
jgi:hypothetical protein